MASSKEVILASVGNLSSASVRTCEWNLRNSAERREASNLAWMSAGDPTKPLLGTSDPLEQPGEEQRPGSLETPPRPQDPQLEDGRGPEAEQVRGDGPLEEDPPPEEGLAPKEVEGPGQEALGRVVRWSRRKGRLGSSARWRLVPKKRSKSGPEGMEGWLPRIER